MSSIELHTHRGLKCVRLGGGWYFNPKVSMQGFCYVGDSTAPDTEIGPGSRYYGPDVWESKDGPMYGRELLKVRPVHWDARFAGHLNEAYGGDRQYDRMKAWPAKLELTDAGRDKGLHELDGLVVGSEEEFVARLKFFAQVPAVAERKSGVTEQKGAFPRANPVVAVTSAAWLGAQL